MFDSPSFESISTQSDVRSSTVPSRPHIPDSKEIEKRFANVLSCMDLPPEKVKLLRSYDDTKKWDLICDQEKVTAKQPPEYYLNKLRSYLDVSGPKIAKFANNKSPSYNKSLKSKFTSSFRIKKQSGDLTTTQILRDLEISLRTNNIQWVRNFLSEEHLGLDVLVSYLSHALSITRCNQPPSKDAEQNTSQTSQSSFLAFATLSKRMNRSSFRLAYSDAMDDIHVSIQCLRAIMNHQHGFNLVFQHSSAINCITLSLNHTNPRTKMLVLELLAAVCLFSGGHQVILSAFDHFKQTCGEKKKFETLMRNFENYEEFHIDFMVACMQFINIVVHSTDDMNYRIHLQHEFTLLKLDEYLEKLRYTESERLHLQVNAYLDNMIDVKLLLEDSDAKLGAIEKYQELELELSFVREESQRKEDEWLSRLVDLEKQLQESREEFKSFKELSDQTMTSLKQQLLSTNQSKPNGEIRFNDALSNHINGRLSLNTPSDDIIGSSVISSPPPPPPLLPPPNLGSFGGAPPPPPPPLFNQNFSHLPIKAVMQPRHRLPVLNWVALKPNQVKGTIFSEIDDEKIYKLLDFTQFENMFRLNAELLDGDAVDGSPSFQRRFNKRIETQTLLDSNRLRNVAITRRKIELSNDDVIKAINNLDLKMLSLEQVEVLTRICLNDQELKTFKTYEQDKKPIDILTDEDKFLFMLLKVERLKQKLSIMSFIGNFLDTYQHLQPQLHSIIAAALSIKNSQKMKRVLEILLALGNYMNASKRGAVYGFKLQSIEMMIDMRSVSNERRYTLIHFLALTLQEKFPECVNFDSDIQCIEKASSVSMENVLADIGELERGMQTTLKEGERWRDAQVAPAIVIRTFHSTAEEKLRKLQMDGRTAQETCNAIVTYYGENPQTFPPSSFFTLFLKFLTAYKQAVIDLESWKKQSVIQPSLLRDKKEIKIDTTKTIMPAKPKQIKEKRHLKRDEIYHGALEDVLLDLKAEPYRRSDAQKKINRTKSDFENNERELQHKENKKIYS